MSPISSDLIAEIVAAVRERTSAEVAELFARCFVDTLSTTMTPMDDGTTFMVTGDIPAMWLRDSAAQLTPYLHFAADSPALADTIASVSRRQLEYVLLDPYANAFNRIPDGSGHHDDRTQLSPWVWERKYEVDSLCYPIRLAHDLWAATGRTDHLLRFADAARAAIAVWKAEQDHERSSTYRFQRPDPRLPTDTLVRDGRGPLVAPTGLTWSGFRPSDDATAYGYNIPGNAFAVTELGHIAVLAERVLGDDELHAEAAALADIIDGAIRAHGVVEHREHGRILAYEVDGLGNALVMDDANAPSLLSLPFLGWCDSRDPLYLRTRAAVLSPSNPFFYSGTAARGIGSPHTPGRNIWPLALAMQGLTSSDADERAELLERLCSTHAGTGLMHESFGADDPSTFTRPWFSWANAVFCEFVLDIAGLRTVVAGPSGATAGQAQA